MKKIKQKTIPKIIINKVKKTEREVYKKTKDHLEYVFDDEDVLKMSQMKFKEDIIKMIPGAIVRFVDPLSLSVSCHIGPGALAVACSIKNY